MTNLILTTVGPIKFTEMIFLPCALNMVSIMLIYVESQVDGMQKH